MCQCLVVFVVVFFLWARASKMMLCCKLDWRVWLCVGLMVRQVWRLIKCLFSGELRGRSTSVLDKLTCRQCSGKNAASGKLTGPTHQKLWQNVGESNIKQKTMYTKWKQIKKLNDMDFGYLSYLQELNSLCTQFFLFFAFRHLKILWLIYLDAGVSTAVQLHCVNTKSGWQNVGDKNHIALSLDCPTVKSQRWWP